MNAVAKSVKFDAFFSLFLFSFVIALTPFCWAFHLILARVFQFSKWMMFCAHRWCVILFPNCIVKSMHLFNWPNFFFVAVEHRRWTLILMKSTNMDESLCEWLNWVESWTKSSQRVLLFTITRFSFHSNSIECEWRKF